TLHKQAGDAVTFVEQRRSKMPQLPVNLENDVAIQNNTTGAVDYLQFSGNTLIHSALFDYGIAGMNIVASDLDGPTGFLTLVAQNPTTGAVDFLGLNTVLGSRGQLQSSAMSNVPVPRIVGAGLFGSPVANQTLLELVSQLPNGE